MSVRDNIKPLSYEEAKTICTGYTYALVYEISAVRFDKTEKTAPEIKWDEVQEAYFFGESGQLHVFRGEDEMQSVVFTDSSDLKSLDKEYELAPKFRGVGSEVVKREYLETDEDGQIFVGYTRLVSVR